jgi:hypothetical protein
MARVQGWANRKDRHPVSIDAIVHRTDGSKTQAKLTNFSDDGCRIEAAEEFRIGERVQIAIPRMGQVKAQVRWSSPGSAGAKFLIESDF